MATPIVGAGLHLISPEPTQALSLALLNSLVDMEQKQRSHHQGQTLLDIDDVGREVIFLELSRPPTAATGNVLLPEGSVVVHDEKRQSATGHTTLPVKVLTVFEGETEEQKSASAKLCRV